MTGYRRGACPGLGVPMLTGDGLIARLRPFGPIEIARWEALCAAAWRYGNGIVEVTARGSLQFRGLSPETADGFAAAVAALEIPAAERPAITTSPLAGHAADSLIDARALAAEIATACIGLAPHPKFSIAIDDGSLLHLDGLAADLRLRAAAPPHDGCLHLAAEGPGESAVPLGAVALRDAAPAVARILAAVGSRRMRDALSDGGLPWLVAAVGEVVDSAAPPIRPAPQPLGLHALAGERAALGVAPAFGQANADALAELGRAAGDAGALGLRPASGRALLLLGIDRRRAASLTVTAAALGFITAPSDPRRSVVACAGAPFCDRGEAPARALAARAAEAFAGLADATCTVHISGCAKGCAHAASAALTLVGDAGNYRLVPSGRVGDPGCAVIPGPTAVPALGRVAALVNRARQPGERVADVLSRLGPRRIAAAVREPGHV